MRSRTIQERARHARKLILDALSGQEDLAAAWERMTNEERDQARTAWGAILERELRAAVRQERERANRIVASHGPRHIAEAMKDALHDLSEEIRRPLVDMSEGPSLELVEGGK